MTVRSISLIFDVFSASQLSRLVISIPSIGLASKTTFRPVSINRREIKSINNLGDSALDGTDGSLGEGWGNCEENTDEGKYE